MKTISHSKVKNTGILFELLVRQVTADILEGKKVSPALSLMREHFSAGTELGKELSLYQAFFSTHNLSEAKALKVIDVVISQRKKLDTKKLAVEKYELVKEISNQYALDKFLSSKINNYRVMASIYKTFLAETSEKDFGDVNDLMNSRFTIMEHIMSAPVNRNDKDVLLEEFKAQADDLRILSYRILVDKFNSKYSGLNDKQKVLLREYINNISNTNSLREYVNSEIPLIKNELSKKVEGIKDKVAQIKLNEVVKQLDTLTAGKTVRDNQVTALMIAYQILREIDNAK